MLDWTDYVQDVVANLDGRQLERICIMEVTEKRWIASDNSLRPTPEQLGKLWNAFHRKLQENVNTDQIQLGQGKVRTFHIRENDGRMLEAVGGKKGAMNEILAAGRTRHYVILAGHNVKEDNGRCKYEVKFITDHLSSSAR